MQKSMSLKYEPYPQTGGVCGEGARTLAPGNCLSVSLEMKGEKKCEKKGEEQGEKRGEKKGEKPGPAGAESVRV